MKNIIASVAMVVAFIQIGYIAYDLMPGHWHGVWAYMSSLCIVIFTFSVMALIIIGIVGVSTSKKGETK